MGENTSLLPLRYHAYHCFCTNRGLLLHLINGPSDHSTRPLTALYGLRRRNFRICLVFAARQSLCLQLKYRQDTDRATRIFIHPRSTCDLHVTSKLKLGKCHQAFGRSLTTQHPLHLRRHTVGAQAGCGAVAEHAEAEHSLGSR